MCTIEFAAGSVWVVVFAVFLALISAAHEGYSVVEFGEFSGLGLGGGFGRVAVGGGVGAISGAGHFADFVVFDVLGDLCEFGLGFCGSAFLLVDVFVIAAGVG